jgi:hypothetical protein
MTPNEQQLIEGFIDQTLDGDQSRELKQSVDERPDVAQELANAIQLHGMGAALRHADYADLIQSVEHSIERLSPSETEDAIMRVIHAPPQKPSSRNWLYIALAIAAQIVIVWAGYGVLSPPASVNIASVSGCSGSTFVVRGEKKQILKPGMILQSDDHIFIEVDSSATLVYDDQSELYLRDRSYIKLIDENGAKHIHLFAGVLNGDIQKQPKGKPLRVHTEYSRATVLGTRFEINSSDISTLLEVTEGSVQFEQLDQKQTTTVKEAEYAVSSPEPGIIVKPFEAPLFKSNIITKNTPGRGVNIEVDVRGAKKLYLVATNGGDNNRFDHVVWLNPQFLGNKIHDVTLQPWTIEKSGWRKGSTINAAFSGGPIRVGEKTYKKGICSHATSLIAYDIPLGCHTFKCRAALLNSGIYQAGSIPSVQFAVYTQLPEEELEKLLIRKSHY